MAKKIRQAEVMELVKEAFQNGFINDHYNGEDFTPYLGILTIPYRSKIYVCPLYEEGCCLNPLYFDPEDGRVHLGTGSVGGTIIPRKTSWEYEIEKYNKDRVFSAGNEFACGPFESLLLIKKEDYDLQQKRRAEILAKYPEQK